MFVQTTLRRSLNVATTSLLSMKRITLIIIFSGICCALNAQSKTTESLNKSYPNSKVFFFYNNTLRMLNQSDDKDFDALIKDIEKMKFLWIDKPETFKTTDYGKITSDYKKESFEEIMTSRHQGKNFDIFMKEQKGKTNGMLVLVNDSSHLYVLDIVGSIALDKVTKLYSMLDKNSDIRAKIAENFNNHKKSH